MSVTSLASIATSVPVYEANIGLRERRRIVDAVANHPNSFALQLELYMVVYMTRSALWLHHAGKRKSPTRPVLIASLTLQAIDNSFEPRLHLLRHLRKARIANRLHGGDGIDG